ncbi:MAG: hypothetical protein ABI268_04475 [Rhodanobacter sp.]
MDKLSVAIAIVLTMLFIGAKPNLPWWIGGVMIVVGATVIALF